MSLPIAWVLKDRPVLLVGGGEVGLTRAKKLVPEECELTVVAPQLCQGMLDMYAHKSFTWVKRNFEDKDLTASHWTFVLTAIPDHDVSEHIAHQCRAQRIPVNVADIISLCDFYFGANYKQTPLRIMVTTGSDAPRLSRRVMDEIIQQVTERLYAEAIQKTGAFRREIRSQLPAADASKMRMSLVKQVCDTLDFNELARLNLEEIPSIVSHLVNAWNQGTIDEAVAELKEKCETEQRIVEDGMEIIATECSPGCPPPTLPPFPYEQ